MVEAGTAGGSGGGRPDRTRIDELSMGWRHGRLGREPPMTIDAAGGGVT